MVHTFKATLCPNGWRVPTTPDFIALDKALGGTGVNNQYNVTLRNKYLSTWGGQYGSSCDSQIGPAYGYTAYYWAQEDNHADYGCGMSYYSDSSTMAPQRVFPQGGHRKFHGMSLRCVK